MYANSFETDEISGRGRSALRTWTTRDSGSMSMGGCRSEDGRTKVMRDMIGE